MRLCSLIVALSLVTACARHGHGTVEQATHASILAPGDSALASGKRAQAYSPNHGWLDGFLMRWTAVGPCIGIYAPDLRGGLVLREIDSLRVDPSIDVGRRPPVTRAALDSLRLPPPTWRSVSVAKLRAQEPAACATI